MGTVAVDTQEEGQTSVTSLDLYPIDEKKNLGGADKRVIFFFVSNSEVHVLLMTVR